jgi:purine-nucleoside/S-methyl-5'-thioadenosine phosphorylase / adenosine deaminase
LQLTDGVHVAITDRRGGVSRTPFASRNLGGAVGDIRQAVLTNRDRTAAELGFDPTRVVLMNQVHGADTAYVTEPWSHESAPLDGLCTNQPGLVLGVLVADCAPVLIADPVAKLVGAAHAGRRGTAAGVVPALVRTMVDRGGDPARMVALVGPTVCRLCYEVSAELHAEYPEAGRAVSRRGTPSLDIRATIVTQFTDHGVVDVRHDDRCTIESSELYSHRREQPTGRFAGYIWLAA